MKNSLVCAFMKPVIILKSCVVFSSWKIRPTKNLYFSPSPKREFLRADVLLVSTADPRMKSKTSDARDGCKFEIYNLLFGETCSTSGEHCNFASSPALVVEKEDGAAKQVGEKTWQSNTFQIFVHDAPSPDN